MLLKVRHGFYAVIPAHLWLCQLLANKSTCMLSIRKTIKMTASLSQHSLPENTIGG